MQDASSKQQTKQKYKPSRQDYHLTQPWTSEEKQTNKKNSAQISPYTKLTQPTGPTFSSVQFSRSVMSNSLQPHELQHTRPPCLSPTFGVHPNSCAWSQWCHPAISSSAFNLSQYQVLSQWVSSSHRVAKVLELQLHSPSNEYSRLMSFRIDWFDLLAVQGTLKSLLQQHSSKASILAIDIHMSPPS